MGISVGLTFLPTVGITVHHFFKWRGLASGVALSGSAVGSTIFPICKHTFYIGVAFTTNNVLILSAQVNPLFAVHRTFH